MKLKLIILLCTLGVLSGCAKSELAAPCPNFGASCHQTPINTWDYPSAQ